MAESSIQNLRVYNLAYELEHKTINFVNSLPKVELYSMGNSLHRSSAAVSHYIYESHLKYSYTLKIDALHTAVAEAENTKRLLAECLEAKYPVPPELTEGYTSVSKQCWGLLKYLKTKRLEKETTSIAKSSNELVAART